MNRRNDADFYHAIRQGLLLQLDAIERQMGLDIRTSELRHRLQCALEHARELEFKLKQLQGDKEL